MEKYDSTPMRINKYKHRKDMCTMSFDYRYKYWVADKEVGTFEFLFVIIHIIIYTYSAYDNKHKIMIQMPKLLNC